MSENADKIVLPEGKKVIRCIVCPTGCEISVENVKGDLKIAGYNCKKGEEYARDEFIAPKRIITATMRVENGFLPIVPVRSEKPIPKDLMFKLIQELSCVKVNAPVKMGDVLVKNIHDLGVNILASRDMPAKTD